MNTEEPDELTRDYQRASSADAGSPAQATREAILAEARKAALRRQPAANDSRYLLRAVAGVAVLGVAVLIWRQQDPQMPLDAKPPEYTVARKAESAAAEAPADTSAIAPAGAPAAPPAPASAAAPAPAPAPAAENAEPERHADTQALSEERSRDSVSTAAPAMRSRAAGQSADAAAESALSPAVADAGDLLQDTFTPAQQEAITPPAAAWVIRDRRGAVLRSGVIASPDGLALIARSAGRDFAQDVGPWTLLQATTSAGRLVDLHVAELQ